MRAIVGFVVAVLVVAGCTTVERTSQASPEPAASAVADETPRAAPMPDAERAPARARTSAAASRPAPETVREQPRTPRRETPAEMEYHEFTVPAGTLLTLALQSAVASDASQVEDSVKATLRAPVTIEGHAVLPPGTEVAGFVTGAERAGRVKGRARVAFRFNSLRYDHERHGIQTDEVERLAEATKGEDATKVGIGAGAGAALGALLGGGSGAAKGAAIGGAAGAGAVLATRGKEVRLEPGEEVETRLTAPLIIRVPLTAER